MEFSIKNKVALVTGGASGIGLCYAKELLRNGVRGITLADVSEEHGAKALHDISVEFGANKAIFSKTDVTNIEEFEEAFKKTLDKFGNIDILINNAGILNDAIWEKEIAININGTVHGMLLGLENYIQKYKTGSEGVIANISSIAGVEPYSVIPVYTATKFAIQGLTLAWGDQDHFKRTKVRVVAIAPGKTDTPLIQDISGRNLGEPYERMLHATIDELPSQPPEKVAKDMMVLLKKAPSGTIWVADAGEPAPYQFVLPMRSTMEKIYLK